MSVSVVIKNAAHSVGEGPYWDPVSKSLFYVDIVVGDVHRWDSQTGEDTKQHFEKSVGFVIPQKSGRFLIGLGQTISEFEWGSSEATVLAEVDQGKETRINDAKCDASGRLWFGTMTRENPAEGKPTVQQGSLYSFEKGNKVTKHLHKIDISNGLAWTEDNSVLYYIDSIPRKVYAFDYDIDAGKISNQRVAVDFNSDPKFSDEAVHGVPDGMCIDNEGKLWVACFDGGQVVRFDPSTGAELQTIKFPASRITSCCFGGPNFDELYVTSCVAAPEKAEREPLAGSVFKVTGLGVTGAPGPVFQN